MSGVELNLSDFLLSEKLGPVSNRNLGKLPSYFDEWNRIADQFTYLWQEKKLRDEIHKLPVLDRTKLSSHEEKVLAHLQLSVFCTGYIFEDENKAKIVPRSVAVPLYEVSESLGVHPYVSYFSVLAGNIIIKNPDESDDVFKTARDTTKTSKINNQQ